MTSSWKRVGVSTNNERCGMKRTIGLALILAALTSCATTGPATDGFCVVGRPILISHQDVLTEGTADQITAHNETGRRLCGWKGRP